MQMITAAFGVALSTLALVAPAAQAAPTEVNVRIEGRAETIFEGPILTDVHKVRASSDKKSRRCDGINVNDPWNVVPAPVPTSASVDAMSIIGQSFDGRWYNQYEDYFVTRWGPDAQDDAKGKYWGILVNNIFTNVGGCQYQLDDGDEVLWAYDAFSKKPILALYPAAYSGGSRALTATAQLGEPFEVEVVAWQGYTEGVPPASPQRTGSVPFEGAEVAPLVTGAGGFEKVDTKSSSMEKTGADGFAEVTFHEYGWQRIKATVAGAKEEGAIRSNRLDVCVPEPPATDCGALLEDDEVRLPPTVALPPDDPEPVGPVATGGDSTAPASTVAAAELADSPRVHLELPRLDRRRVARGLVGVGWRVLDAGVGVRKWTISSRRLGGKGARFVTRARGTTKTSVTVRLPLGATYQLRITIVDALGRTSTAPIGKVLVPA